jgi:heavy metal translocating P-type ATPase
MGSCCSCEIDAEESPAGEWAKLGIAGVVAAQSMIFGLAVNLSPPAGMARTVLHTALAVSAVVVFVLAGSPVVRSSWAALKRGRVVFDQLFLLGMVAAFAASVHSSLTGVGHVYYEIVAILLAIHTFGGLLTESRRRQALDAAGDLGREFATCERVSCCGVAESVPVTDIRRGDRVRISLGGAVSIDGEVEEGMAFVRESALTGEPFPVVKRKGDLVRAGSYSLDGTLFVVALSDGNARGLDRLLEALEEARGRPSRLQRQADRLASWFLPVVVVIAAGTFAFWTWHSGWMQGLFHALAVILVACPCAMGIATPVAIWSALAAFARAGLVTRNPDLVEKLASVDTVVFDKTGTLGEEAMELVDFVTVPNGNRHLLRSQVAALEAVSDHPIARAFRQFADPAVVASQVRVVPGVGLTGSVHGIVMAVGNANLLNPEQRTQAEHLWTVDPDPGGHRIFVTQDGELCAAAWLRETLREGSRESLAGLGAMGVRCQVMTGDQSVSVERHNLPSVSAGLSPEEKARNVRQLEEQGHRVLFVGDGINDSAAMREASASVAIRGGAPMARESADGELPGSNLADLPGLIQRSRSAVQTIRGNLLFAAAYNLIGISLAAIGVLHPVAASLIMLASSFTVTWRALRESQPASTRSADSGNWVRDLGWLAPVVTVAAFLQGPALAWLGSFPQPTSVGIILLFAAMGVGLFVLVATRRTTGETTNLLLMFSVGGLLMLVGWWADAGFDRVVRDGVCLCNCKDSTMGLGIFAKWNWMDLSMVAASLPMLVGIPRSGRWLCWIAGIAGMLLGMEVAALLASQIPTVNPRLSFFAGYGVMLFGMVLGMVLFCGAARKFSK